MGVIIIRGFVLEYSITSATGPFPHFCYLSVIFFASSSSSSPLYTFYKHQESITS